MNPPFTIDQFLEVFKNYNRAVFPAQLVLYLISRIVIYLAVKPNSKSDKAISFILAMLWLWMGIVYHLIFFTAINKAAYLLGVVFILQGILFLVFGVLKNKLSFKFQFDRYGITGLVLVLFSLIVYPILGYTLGHIYPASPTFGLPCPTTIFTFGILLFTDKKLPIVLVIIPVVWSAVGFAAAFSLGIREDIGLAIAGGLFMVLLLVKNRNLVKKETILQRALHTTQ
jgi:Family of unknown function (DUF6064)